MSFIQLDEDPGCTYLQNQTVLQKESRKQTEKDLERQKNPYKQ